MPTVPGLLRTAGLGMAAAAVPVYVAALLLFWRAVRGGRNFQRDFGMALLIGLLMAPHAYAADCALLMLILPLLAPRVELRSVQYIVYILLTPVPYLLLLQGLPTNICLPALLLVLVFLCRPAHLLSVPPDRTPLAAHEITP